MVDISAPKPRRAPSSRPPPRTQSLPSTVVDDTFYCVSRPRALASPPRLLSPYRLSEDAGVYKLSKPPCSPTKRRRGLARNLSRSIRHRHCGRADCCINNPSGTITSFDDLPWISALSIEPDSANPWDIADLSLLSPDVEDAPSSTGPGPVRRRKTSLRQDPLAHPSTNGDELLPSMVTFPFARRALFAQSNFVPQTPPPRERFCPSEVVFQGLRPIFPSGVEELAKPIDLDASY